MNVNSYDFREALANRVSDAKYDRGRLAMLRESAAHHQSETKAELDKARSELAATLLPTWDQTIFQTCAQWVGLPRLATAPFEILEKDRQQLEKDLAAIRANPLYVQRMEVADPETGSLVLKLQDLRANCESLYPFTRPCESHPRWQRLLESGYGTARYSVRWWHLSYYADWKAGDEIAELFPGKEFPEVRKVYEETRAALDDLEIAAADVMREIEDIRQLERDYQEKSQRLAHLHDVHLAETRKNMLIPHLHAVPDDTLLDRFRAWPAVFPLVARFLGLKAKVEYLDEIVALKIRALEGLLESEIAKLEAKRMKVARPKKAARWYPKAHVESLRQRSQKVRNNVDRIQGMLDRVGGFNAWDVALPAAGAVLWWDIITDGRINGDFLPSVQAFKRGHPDYVYVLEKDRRPEFEAAAAEAELTAIPELADDFS